MGDKDQGQAENQETGEDQVFRPEQYTDDAAWAKAHGELESKLGSQGQELGDVKRMNELLLEKMESGQQKETPEKQVAVDYDKELAEIAAQVKEGDIGIEEGILQSSKISAEIASAMTLEKVNKNNTKQIQQDSQAQFLQDNPDFNALQKNGTLQKMKQSLPGFHDDVSAYYALQAQQAKSGIESAKQEGIQVGKEEATKVASGDKNTGKVISKPGAGNEQNIGKGDESGSGKTLSKTEMKNSMMQAVLNSRK